MVSVVIPAYNGAGTIGRTIECLLQQSLKPLEIIVVDDGSTDNTSDILTRFANQIVYLPKRNGGPASARNLGVKHSRADYVAFTDSDCLPDSDWLLNLMRGFDSPEVGGAGGIVRSVEAKLTCEYIDAIRLLDPQTDELGEIAYLITANACFKRRALLDAGLFDERFRKPGGEEAELCFRIKEHGYRLRLVADAVVLHHHRQSAVSLLKTLANYGEGAFMIAKILPARRIDHPFRVLLRRLISLRFIARQLLNYATRYGLKKAFYFSLLDYLRQPAFLFGYLRGQRREP
ncbi:MAG: glycosyltransferase [Acidobacteria bacterium]|nr:glycosyltransferase [Acidobacteriota bacterium]